jgi:hypothetical protein
MKKWLYIGIVVWGVFGIVMVCLKDWFALQAIATWLLAVGVFLAVWQQWESRRRTRIEFTEKRIEALNTQDVKEGLEIIYKKTPSKLSELKKEDLNKVMPVLEHMHTLGLLVQKGYADKELAIETHRGKFIRCWYKLMPCICYERKERGKYGEGIEYLAKEAYKYQQKKLPKKHWAKLDGKVCEIDASKSCESDEE